MIISGGENVYPAEVENVLADHPAVQEASIAGVPDEKWGEVGCAHIILRQGSSCDAAALTAWCRERLAAYKVPRQIDFIDEVPKSAVGKVLRRNLQPRHRPRLLYPTGLHPGGLCVEQLLLARARPLGRTRVAARLHCASARRACAPFGACRRGALCSLVGWGRASSV